MKPQLRFKEFTDEWEKKKLKEITTVITKGTTPKIFTSKMNDINFIKIDCLSNGFIDKTKCLKISNEIHNNELKRSILIENDLLFSIAGSLGKVSIVNQNILPANTNQALSIIRLKDNVCVNYVYFYLDSQSVKKYISSLQSIGAQPNINLEQVSQIKIQLPSLPEQEKIGKFLSLLDQRIEKQERKVALLEEEKKGYMQQIFNQELRFKDEQGNDYPDWEEKKLGDISEKVQDGNYGASYPKNNELMSDGIPFLTAKNISGNKIEITDYISLEKNNELLKAQICFGDIILTNRGTFPRPVVLNDQINTGNIGPQLTLIRIKDSNYNNMYIYQYMLSNKIQKEILLESGGSTMGFISLKSTKELKIQLPSLPEQEKIGNFLSLLDQRIEKEQEKLKLMREEKKGLMQRMFV